MHRQFLIALSLLFCFSCVSAIVCWECEFTDSQAENPQIECLGKGKLTECAESQEACGIILRHGGWGDQPVVRKTCISLKACGANHVQDSRPAWVYVPDPDRQCTMEPPSSVCRCCCTSNGCNTERLYCRPPEGETELIGGLPCNKITRPRNGMMKCEGGFDAPSECTFSCRKGFKLVGSAVSKCDLFSVRDFEPPTCEPILCEALADPENGSVVCSRGNRIKSRCRFSCNPGYRLSGDSLLECFMKNEASDTGLWSRVIPICE
ncbi:E-selectin-like [Clavelina lepadiformis]|uniref:E-selectin-like n=1 Tax=Clavelina lepadiformis TaxID=159417 RepID=UPI0040433AA7